MPPWLVSTLLHTALILVLAILTMTQIEDKQVSLTVETGERLEDFTEIKVLEFEEMELEQDQSLETTSDALDSSMSEIESPLQLESEVVDFAEMIAALGDLGETLELAGEELAMTRFFGQEQNGRKFVSVLDNSNSMGRGKFETALTELSKTVNGFSDKQQFHVIFFSDTAYLMFHPKPVTELVRATDKNLPACR